MLYNKEDFVHIVFRLYGRLQTSVKFQPRTLKIGNKSHEKTLDKFYRLLPEDAGVDFLWDFLVFQFYIYQGQNHQQKPNPNWFMGEEAFKRWYEYDTGARWHSKEWASSKGLKNPLKKNVFKKITDDSLLNERLRFSRISGPNYCFMKYGDSCFDPDSDICIGCPFFGDCRVVSGLNLDNQLGGSNVKIL